MSNTKLWILVCSIVAFGLSVPIFPRLIIPVVIPARYLDTLDIFWQNPGWAIGIILWTDLPFAILAYFVRFHLEGTNLNSFVYFSRIAASTTAFITILGLGFLSHIPQTSPGVNMWVFFFPILACLSMPVSYGIGSIFWKVFHSLYNYSTSR